MRLEAINRNKNGDFYVIYSLPSPQKINRKMKPKRELLILGIPKSKFYEMLPMIAKDCDEEIE